jgi:hypothetical protein
VRVVVNDASVDDGSLAIEIALSGASLKTPDTLLIEKKKNICFFLSTKEMLTLNSATKDIQTVALYKENEPGFLDIYPHHHHHHHHNHHHTNKVWIMS